MRVGLFVDALSPVRTGIGRYCWELSRGVPTDPRVTSVSYLLGDQFVDDPARLVRPAERERRWRRALKNFRGRKRASASTFDIVHSPNYFIPEWVDCGIATIHDLSVFRYPETHPAERITAFERQFSKTLEKASHLIVDCETIRRELIEYTGFTPDRVSAIALGVDEAFQPVAKEDRTAILNKYGLPMDGYGLTLAALEPRKRIDRLISAWSLLPKALLSRFPLVVAGATGWKNEQLRRQIERAAAEGWLIPLDSFRSRICREYIPEPRFSFSRHFMRGSACRRWKPWLPGYPRSSRPSHAFQKSPGARQWRSIRRMFRHSRWRSRTLSRMTVGRGMR